MSVAAIVPFQHPGRGKSRLSRWLSPGQRAALATAMLHDVIDTVASVLPSDFVIAARGAAAASAARSHGVRTVDDPPGGPSLNAAVANAAATVDAAHDLLVVMADLPLLIADDLACLLASTDDVAIAPTRDGGTAALLRRAQVTMPTAYGPGSAHAHHRLASARDLSVSFVESPGFQHDLDTIEDLRSLDVDSLGSNTRRALAQLAVG